MAESIVADWLSDYASLEAFEIRSFASQHENNHEIAHALFTILNERLKYPDLLHSICNQFYSFYRSTETILRKFTLQFVPTLIYIYLNSVAQGDKKSCRSVETLLISVYNIEITNDDGQTKTVSFRMPVLAQASIYHEEKSLHASDLRRWEENSNKDVNWGPLHQVESINAQNRLKVVTALLFVYNQQLSLIPKSALSHLCRIASQLANQGFSKIGHAHRSSYGSDPNNAIAPKPLCHIPMSSQFLLELLHAVYFAMFSDFGSIAIQSVDDIHNRACYELFPEVILVTNAIKNSLHANLSGQPSDGPMGLGVALTPTTSTVTVSKSMIPNASFRTKKLPVKTHNMAESIVADWLSDYASLEAFEIRSFASQHENNHEIAHALFTILNERLKYPDLLHSICNQFYSFYRSTETILRKFTLQFVPTLIYIYLNSVAQGDKKSCRSVETLLISVYNIEITNDDGQTKTVSFRMPVLAQASIYHEEKSLHASDLRRWEENSNKDVNWGPLHQVESINAQNRLKVVTALLFVYNQQLSLIPKSALSHLCRIASQLANQGFSKIGHAHRSSYGSDPNNAIAPKPLCRIPMSSQFLLELLHAVYFAMFSDFGSIAIQSVDDIHNRACYELFPEVILVTNAIKNSLHANLSGQPSDGPMGLGVALTPTTSTVTVSKSMIPNASFRTKKLPDDIPIQGAKDDPSQLLSITEETEGEPTLGSRNTSTRGSKDTAKLHKVLFPGFKKSKDKEKDSKNATAKNGSISEPTTNQPTKCLINKLTNRGSNQISADIGDGLDKTLPPLKQRNSTNDILNGVSETVPMQSLTNGAANADDKIQLESHNTCVDTSDSIDTISPDESIGTQCNSITTEFKQLHMQVSQV